MPAGLLLAILCSFAALLYGYFTIKWVLDKPDGNEKMVKIASAIQEGSTAYFKRQYAAIGIVGFILTIVLFFALDAITAFGFVIGAILSSLATNTKCQRAKHHCCNNGYRICFK